MIHCVKEKKTQGGLCPFLFSLSSHSLILSFFSMWTSEVAIAVGATTTIPITIGAWNFNQTLGIINKNEGGKVHLIIIIILFIITMMMMMLHNNNSYSWKKNRGNRSLEFHNDIGE
jgi:hypothetical protein